MKLKSTLMIGALFAATAHANVDSNATSFTITHPTVAASDSQNMYTLTLAEGKAAFALNPQTAILSLTCGPANQSDTSLFAVSLNGEVKLMGRKKDCRASVEKIAAIPARFAMRITLTPNPESRSSPGAEYLIEAKGE